MILGVVRRALESVLDVLAEGLPHWTLHEDRVGRVHLLVSAFWRLGARFGLIVEVGRGESVDEILELSVLDRAELR